LPFPAANGFFARDSPLCFAIEFFLFFLSCGAAPFPRDSPLGNRDAAGSVFPFVCRLQFGTGTAFAAIKAKWLYAAPPGRHKLQIKKEKSMRQMTRRGLTAWMLLVVFAAAIGAQTTIRRSYYVNAVAGDDGNDGRSENQAFKTMDKALEAAKMEAVKTIAIIGPIDGFEARGTGQDEILIIGKPDAGETEKAVINGEVNIGGGVSVKFTYVTIENSNGMGISNNGKVTLGQNTVIQNCKYNGINSMGGSISLTDNAMITGCDRGISGEGTIVVTDDASVTHNNIGIYYYGSRSFSWMLSGNARISNNLDGGIIWVDNGNPTGTVTISGNAEISNNTATRTGAGGGVFVRNLNMNGGRIVNNTAEGLGGGVYCYSMKMTGGEISGNQASRGGGIYINVTYGDSVISGGAISGNRAEYGAGIFLEKTFAYTFTLSGGSITDNEAELAGGGIYAESGVIYTATGGTVTGNTAGNNVGHNVFNQ
jgi:hypothetical protein